MSTPSRITRNVSERYEFLKTQQEDLMRGRADAGKQIIEELDEGMRRQFAEKFGEISREFDQVFQRAVRRRARAALELVEDEDILEAGIADHRPASGQEAAEHDAALRRGEGADGHCACCLPSRT